MISSSYRGYAVEQRAGLFYVPALRQTLQSEWLAYAAIDRDIQTGEAVVASLQSQDRYYRSVGGRDPEPTYREGWRERYQRVLREAAE